MSYRTRCRVTCRPYIVRPRAPCDSFTNLASGVAGISAIRLCRGPDQVWSEAGVYFRTGTGPKGVGSATPPRSWAPFHGLDPRRGDPVAFPLNKDSFYPEFETSELRGYGKPGNRRLALRAEDCARRGHSWQQAQAELSATLKPKPLAPVTPPAIARPNSIQLWHNRTCATLTVTVVPLISTTSWPQSNW
jgi:hypothetical protein